MLRPDGLLALLDFGAARQMSVVGERSNTINVKHGFAPEDLAASLESLAALRHLEVRGLMAIPPPGRAAEDSRPHFRRLAGLRDELARRPEWRARGFAGELSMGMSDDFEVAIEEGATQVRIGSALFGERPA